MAEIIIPAHTKDYYRKMTKAALKDQSFTHEINTADDTLLKVRWWSKRRDQRRIALIYWTWLIAKGIL